MSLRQKEKEKIARAMQTAPRNAFNCSSLGLLATGIGFIKLFEYPLLITLGWLLISISIFILIRAYLSIVPEENCYLKNCRMI
jgi:hypothetical protein